MGKSTKIYEKEKASTTLVIDAMFYHC